MHWMILLFYDIVSFQEIFQWFNISFINKILLYQAEEEKIRKEEAEKKAKEAEEKKKRMEEAESKRQAMLEAQKVCK